MLRDNCLPRLPQGKRIKMRSSFEVLPRENGRLARLETDYRMKTPCAIHRRDACAPCISKTQRDFNAFALALIARKFFFIRSQ